MYSIVVMFPLYRFLFNCGDLTDRTEGCASHGSGQQQGETLQGGHGVPPPPHTLRREDHSRQRKSLRVFLDNKPSSPHLTKKE